MIGVQPEEVPDPHDDWDAFEEWLRSREFFIAQRIRSGLHSGFFAMIATGVIVLLAALPLGISNLSHEHLRWLKRGDLLERLGGALAVYLNVAAAAIACVIAAFLLMAIYNVAFNRNRRWRR